MTVQAHSGGFRYNFLARLLAIAYAATLLSAAGCATPPHRSRLLAHTTEVKTDERLMRSALYEYTYRFSRTVELASKRIAAEGGDPEIARRALYWRFAATSEIWSQNGRRR